MAKRCRPAAAETTAAFSAAPKGITKFPGCFSQNIERNANIQTRPGLDPRAGGVFLELFYSTLAAQAQPAEHSTNRIYLNFSI